METSDKATGPSNFGGRIFSADGEGEEIALTDVEVGVEASPDTVASHGPSVSDAASCGTAGCMSGAGGGITSTTGGGCEVVVCRGNGEEGTKAAGVASFAGREEAGRK